MANRTLALAAAFAAFSVPASASVLVIGSSDARMCFEAADSPLMPSSSAMLHCDLALADAAIDTHDEAATHVNRGILRMRRNQADAAIADFDSALEIEPGLAEAYLNKGAALIRFNGDQAEAVRLFTAALEHDTARPELAHFGRAIANEGLGNVRGAYHDYQQASQLNPRWQLPRRELARFRVVSN